MKGLLSLLTFLAGCLLALFHEESQITYSHNLPSEIEVYQQDDLLHSTTFTHQFIEIKRTLEDEPTNVTFHYVTTGIKSNIPVVFLHGFPDSWAVWRHAMGEMKKEGFYSIAFDLKGLGQSSKPMSSVLFGEEQGEIGGNYSFSFAASEIVAALDQIEVKKFHLVSHDLGMNY